MDFVAAQLEPGTQHPPYIGAVLDKQDTASACGSRSCRRGPNSVQGNGEAR
jgi:hypothetical protein